MISPSNWSILTRWIIGVAMILFCFILIPVTSFAQKSELAASATIEQCRNGSVSSPVSCGNASNPLGWVTGSSSNPQAHWNETEYVPYRVLFSGLPGNGTTVHTVVMGYDILHSGVHALDYLGTYNLTETTAMGNDPCHGVAHCNALLNPNGDSQTLIPVDPVINTFPLPRPTMPATGKFTMWGGTLIGCSYVDPYDGGVERRISCSFTSTVSNPVLAWGGHIAWQGEWGAGNSAGNINGNPYHMRLKSLDGASTGNQDLALSANAVIIPAKVTIEKDAIAPPNTDPSNFPFNFTASPSFGTTAFTLYDGPTAPVGANMIESQPITQFGSGNPISVTENASAWSLTGISCSGTGIFNAVTSIALRNLSLTVGEGATVHCVFTNQFLGPSSAPASVSGRVSTAEGQAIGNARIAIHNANTGEVWVTYTNTFGYYRIEGLPIADFYIITVLHKRYLFLEASRGFTLEEDLVNVNFTASSIE